MTFATRLSLDGGSNQLGQAATGAALYRPDGVNLDTFVMQLQGGVGQKKTKQRPPCCELI